MKSIYKKTGIYCIENTITNRKYIGQSVNLTGRWGQHRSALKRHVHDNKLIQADYDLYGIESFKFTILELCKAKQLDEREIYYIERCNTTDLNTGYNLRSGGVKSWNGMTEYATTNLSNAIKRHYQITDAKETQRKNALKQWANPAIKAKIMGENNGMYGRTHTAEAREKMRQAATGRPSARRNRTKVYCVELDKIYEDAATAARELSLSSGTLLDTCKGNRKTHGGYHWQFYYNSENN